MYTQEQKNAIEARGRNVLVSAAAGSGKTSVLVGRIMSLITDYENPVHIDRLLVLTFANASAEEMRSRLREALSKGLKADPTNTNLRSQMQLIAKANISTIHTFALYVLRQYFHAAEIDPHFTIADDDEMKILKQELLNELLEKRHTEASQDFLKLVDSYDGTKAGSNRLAELVLLAHDFVMNIPFYDIWLDEAAEMFLREAAQTPWYNFMMAGFKAKIRSICIEVQHAIDIAGLPGGPHKYIPRLEEELDMLESVVQAADCTHAHLFKLVKEAKFNRLPGETKSDLQEEVKGLRNSYKEEFKKNCKFLEKSQDQHNEDIACSAPLVNCFIGMVKDFSKSFSREKRRRNQLDFNDLEHLCLKVLVDESTGMPTAAARELAASFEYTMIDEYQDSSPVQEKILQAVSREANRFMVGDVKQSIYRFRSADPSIFMEKYDMYSAQPCNTDKNYRINLHVNFRSRREVLEATNFVFAQIMSKASCGIAYDENVALKLPTQVFAEACDGSGFECELLLGINAMEDEEDERDEGDAEGQVAEDLNNEDYSMTKSELEAELVAARIAELVAGGDVMLADKLTGEKRSPTFSDIVILMRSLKKEEHIFSQVFERKNIPLVISKSGDSGQGKVFSGLEVSALLDFMRIVDNPRQDIPLAGVLCSPMVGIEPDELLELRLAYPEGDLYTCVVAYSQGGGVAGLRRNLGAFLEQLDGLRDIAPHISVGQLCAEIMERTGYAAVVGAQPGGERGLAKLRRFQEYAYGFDKSRRGGLYAFLCFVQRVDKPKEAIVEAQDEAGAVRMMTIHKSKGLEFPIVFLSGTHGKFEHKELKQDIVLHKQLGIGLRLVDLGRRTKRGSISRDAISEAIRREELADEMRKLYVAMTRARDKLIITGALKDEKKLKSHSSTARYATTVIDAQKVLSAGSFLDWLKMAFCRHKEGGVLRQAGEGTHSLAALEAWPASLVVRVFKPEDIKQMEALQDAAVDTSGVEIEAGLKSGKDMACYEDIEKVFSWEYPFREGMNMPSKLAISDIKRIHQPDDIYAEAYKPLGRAKHKVYFGGNGGFTPMELGTIAHTVLQNLNLDEVRGRAGVEGLVRKLVDGNILKPGEADAVPLDEIAAFTHSCLAGRMIAAGDVRREVAFVAAMQPGEIYPRLRDAVIGLRPIMVHGIIDAFFVEDGEAVIVDYKSDRYFAGTGAEVLRERYAVQMSVYKKAVERATGFNVKECVLYMLSSGEEVSL